MKKAVKKIIKILKQFLLYFLNIFFNPKPQKNIRKKEKEVLKKQIYSKEYKAFKPKEEEDTSSSPKKDRYQEYKQKKKFTISKEHIEKSFYKILEKTFEINIQELSSQKKETLKAYTEKIWKKEKLQEEKIESLEALEESIQNIVNEELVKKEKDLNRVIDFKSKTFFDPTVNTSTKEEEALNKSTEEKNDFLMDSNINLEPFVSTPVAESFSKNEVVEEKKSFYENSPSNRIQNTNEDYKNDFLKQDENSEIKDPEILMSNKKDNREIGNNNNTKPIEITNNPQEETKSDLKIEEKSIAKKEENKNFLKEKDERKNDLQVEEKPIAKEENKNSLKEKDEKIEIINLLEISEENILLYTEAKNEWEKEDILDKEYTEMERKIQEYEEKIEKILQSPISKEQKQKLTQELNKLHETKKQMSLHKEQDLEEIRKSLEEGIPLEELESISKKLKEFHNKAELEKKELYYNQLAKKSEIEIKQMEKILIKETLRRNLKYLEIRRFYPLSFIKNKFFRRLVSGLFMFHSFHFLHNFIFGEPTIYTPTDLSFIEKGSDCLAESIQITEKNLNAFQELKEKSLQKYPSLLEDEEFISYTIKLEKSLEKNYAKLLKQKAIVNKFFYNSQIMRRKQKKIF